MLLGIAPVEEAGGADLGAAGTTEGGLSVSKRDCCWLRELEAPVAPAAVVAEVLLEAGLSSAALVLLFFPSDSPELSELAMLAALKWLLNCETSPSVLVALVGAVVAWREELATVADVKELAGFFRILASLVLRKAEKEKRHKT